MVGVIIGRMENEWEKSREKWCLCVVWLRMEKMRDFGGAHKFSLLPHQNTISSNWRENRREFFGPNCPHINVWQHHFFFFFWGLIGRCYFLAWYTFTIHCHFFVNFFFCEFFNYFFYFLFFYWAWIFFFNKLGFFFFFFGWLFAFYILN